jgi:peroxiredoxin
LDQQTLDLGGSGSHRCLPVFLRFSGATRARPSLSGMIPWLVEFQKKYQGHGLVVIGVSMDSDGWKSVKPWLKEKKVNYPVVIGSDDLGKQYGLEGMPLTALIDRDGKLAAVHPGLVNKDATDQRLRALLQQTAKP